jgi:hypothetical protein
MHAHGTQLPHILSWMKILVVASQVIPHKRVNDTPQLHKQRDTPNLLQLLVRTIDLLIPQFNKLATIPSVPLYYGREGVLLKLGSSMK